MRLLKSQWNLKTSHRLLIATLAAVYLLVFRPWSAGVDGSSSIYAGVVAMLVLAGLPPKFRLLTALLIALGVAVLFLVGLQVLGAQV